MENFCTEEHELIDQCIHSFTAVQHQDTLFAKLYAIKADFLFITNVYRRNALFINQSYEQNMFCRMVTARYQQLHLKVMWVACVCTEIILRNKSNIL